MTKKDIVIGQEAVVPEYGLGRVRSFCLDMPHRYIEVEPYIFGYSMSFSPDNVKLIKLNYVESGEQNG